MPRRTILHRLRRLRGGHTLVGRWWLVPMGVLNACLCHGALWSRAPAPELILRRLPASHLGFVTDEELDRTLNESFCLPASHWREEFCPTLFLV